MIKSWLMWGDLVSNYYAPWVESYAKSFVFTRGEAARIARSISAEDLGRSAGDDGWTLRDEITHIAASDADFIATLGTILEGGTPDTSIFADIDARNARHLAARRDQPAHEVATELERNAYAIDELVLRLTADDQSRQPEGIPFALGQLIDGYAQHDAYHLGQINAALDGA